MLKNKEYHRGNENPIDNIKLALGSVNPIDKIKPVLLMALGFVLQQPKPMVNMYTVSRKIHSLNRLESDLRNAIQACDEVHSFECKACGAVQDVDSYDFTGMSSEVLRDILDETIQSHLNFQAKLLRAIIDAERNEAKK